MTDRVDFGPLTADYERFRVGYGDALHDFVGERLTAGPEGPVLDLAGDRLEEFIAGYRSELEKLCPALQPFEERNVIYLFGGRKRLQGPVAIRHPSPAAP